MLSISYSDTLFASLLIRKDLIHITVFACLRFFNLSASLVCELKECEGWCLDNIVNMYGDCLDGFVCVWSVSE